MCAPAAACTAQYDPQPLRALPSRTRKVPLTGHFYMGTDYILSPSVSTWTHRHLVCELHP